MRAEHEFSIKIIWHISMNDGYETFASKNVTFFGRHQVVQVEIL